MKTMMIGSEDTTSRILWVVPPLAVARAVVTSLKKLPPKERKASEYQGRLTWFHDEKVR
jgi:hypothetical protein